MLDVFRSDAGDGRQLGHARVILGRELVQRRVDQANRHRFAVHGREDAHEVGPLERQQLGKRRLARLHGVRDDHLLDGQTAFLGVEEHVLGAAQADAFSAHADGVLRIIGCIGIGADLDRAEFVGPLHQRAEGGGLFGQLQGQLADVHFAG